MARNDSEAMTLAVVAHIKSSLNDRITAINAEKADDVTLPTIEAAAYTYQDFGESSPNFVPCVYINASTEVGETSGVESSETVRIWVEIVTSDCGAGSEGILKVLSRYRRVLREVLASHTRLSRSHARIIDFPERPLGKSTGQNLWTIAQGIEFTIVT